MRNSIILGVLYISIMTILGLSIINTLNNRLDIIISPDSVKSNEDPVQIMQKEEKEIAIELQSITDFVIEFVIPTYIDFMNTKINQNRNKKLNLNGEK